MKRIYARYINQSLPFATALLMLMLATGCGSQADSEYAGKSLMNLTGKVNNSLTTEVPSDLEVALIWTDHYSEKLKALATKVKVEGGFPSEFKISVYQPPPENAFLRVQNTISARIDNNLPASLDNTRAASGTLFVLRKGAYDNLESVKPADVWGVNRKVLIAYFDRDVAPNTLTSDLYGGGSFNKGYHLFFTNLPSTEEKQAINACYLEEQKKNQPLTDCIEQCPEATPRDNPEEVDQEHRACIDACYTAHQYVFLCDDKVAKHRISAVPNGFEEPLEINLNNHLSDEDLWPLFYSTSTSNHQATE